jgi:hypothetical protein
MERQDILWRTLDAGEKMSSRVLQMKKDLE